MNVKQQQGNAIDEIFHIQENSTIQIGSENNKILSLRHDPTDQYIAVASEDGSSRIIYKPKFQVIYTLSDTLKSKTTPATCIRWNTAQNNSIHNSFLTTYIGGKCIYWHATSQQILAEYHEDEKNDLQTCEFTPDGKRFITAGTDAKVRVYDIGKKKPTLLEKGVCPEHKNRIYASKFVDDNILLTAGWDINVLIWDLRTHSSQGYIYGPMVYGDALDYQDNTVLTGSFRGEKQLQIWDLRKMSKIQDIDWGMSEDSTKSFIYSCQFSKYNKQFIAAGSTNTNEIRIFENKNGMYKYTEAFKKENSTGIFTLDWSFNKNQFTFGTSEGKCTNVSVE